MQFPRFKGWWKPGRPFLSFPICLWNHLDNQIILFSTDLEVGIRVGIDAEILEAGEVALPAKTVSRHPP